MKNFLKIKRGVYMPASKIISMLERLRDALEALSEALLEACSGLIMEPVVHPVFWDNGIVFVSKNKRYRHEVDGSLHPK